MARLGDVGDHSELPDVPSDLDGDYVGLKAMLIQYNEPESSVRENFFGPEVTVRGGDIYEPSSSLKDSV